MKTVREDVRRYVGMKWSNARRRTWGWGLDIINLSRNNGVALWR